MIAFVLVEFLFIKLGGTPVPAPTISRELTTFGSSGTQLTYIVMGDSTGVGQGGDYEKGIALSTSRELAKTHIVRFQNFAISGARTADVRQKQLAQAVALKPDVVLIAVGANDVTHLTSLKGIHLSLNEIIDALRAANPDVKIILTGSPQMGSVPRFPEPVASIARARTKSVNAVFEMVATEKQVTFAHIADKTGPIFDAHPELFAADKFHPTTTGYGVWIPVLNTAIASSTR
ncbi:MAG: SGNH/GDSL hydrolase family protein [Candidatus Saccharimonadales bacterium]